MSYDLLVHSIITDKEYVQNRRSHALDRCETRGVSDARVVTKDGETTENGDEVPTDEEIQECINKVHDSAISQRNYNFKQDMIGGVVRSGVFIFLFASHFPFFMKLGDE